MNSLIIDIINYEFLVFFLKRCFKDCKSPWNLVPWSHLVYEIGLRVYGLNGFEGSGGSCSLHQRPQTCKPAKSQT